MYPIISCCVGEPSNPPNVFTKPKIAGLVGDVALAAIAIAAGICALLASQGINLGQLNILGSIGPQYAWLMIGVGGGIILIDIARILYDLAQVNRMLRQDLAEANQSAAQQKQKLEETEKDLAEARKPPESQVDTNEVEQLKQQLQDLQDQLAQAKSQPASASAIAATDDSQLRATIMQLQLELEGTKTELQKRTEELVNARTLQTAPQNDSLIVENRQLQDKLAQLKTQVSELTQKVTDVTSQSTLVELRLADEKESLKKQLDEKEAQVQRASKNLEEFKPKFQELKQTLVEQLASLNAQITTLKQTIEEKEAQIQYLTQTTTTNVLQSNEVLKPSTAQSEPNGVNHKDKTREQAPPPPLPPPPNPSHSPVQSKEKGTSNGITTGIDGLTKDSKPNGVGALNGHTVKQLIAPSTSNSASAATPPVADNDSSDGDEEIITFRNEPILPDIQIGACQSIPNQVFDKLGANSRDKAEIQKYFSEFSQKMQMQTARKRVLTPLQEFEQYLSDKIKSFPNSQAISSTSPIGQALNSIPVKQNMEHSFGVNHVDVDNVEDENLINLFKKLSTLIKSAPNLFIQIERTSWAKALVQALSAPAQQVSQKRENDHKRATLGNGASAAISMFNGSITQLKQLHIDYNSALFFEESSKTFDLSKLKLEDPIPPKATASFNEVHKPGIESYITQVKAILDAKAIQFPSEEDVRILETQVAEMKLLVEIRQTLHDLETSPTIDLAREALAAILSKVGKIDEEPFKAIYLKLSELSVLTDVQKMHAQATTYCQPLMDRIQGEQLKSFEKAVSTFGQKVISTQEKIEALKQRTTKFKQDLDTIARGKLNFMKFEDLFNT